MPAPSIDTITVAADPVAWRAAGFRVTGDECLLGTVRLRLTGAVERRPIAGWSLRGVPSVELDGLPTELSDSEPRAPAEPHPNGVSALDHVVVFTPSLERTVAAIEAAGLDLRRLREGDTHGRQMRQAFFRLAEVILEVVDAPEGSPLRDRPGASARFWGLALLSEDLESTTAHLGQLASEPRDAVQPGRRIATARENARLGPAVAFMSPGPGAA